MAKYNSKQALEEHQRNLEILNIEQKFTLKMTLLICSLIFCSIIILAIFFGSTTLVGIIIAITIAIFFSIIVMSITRSIGVI